MLPLAALALRRTLPAWLAAASLVLLVLAARAPSGSVASGLFEAGDGRAAGLRALARQNVWSVLLVLAPVLLFEAARLGTSAARAWLAPTPAPALALALAHGAGVALACAAATALTACIGELASEAEAPAWRRSEVLDSPRTVLFEDARSVRWNARASGPGARLRLWVTVAPGGGPVARARFSAQSGGASRALEVHVAGRRALELELPVAAGALALELERLGPGAPLVVGPGALELLAPVASERAAALTLAARAWLALATCGALALGLGAWLRPALAAGVVLALALGAWTRAGAAAWMPGADWPRAWDELSAGLVPGLPPATTLCGALALTTLGIGLYARALRRAEGAP